MTSTMSDLALARDQVGDVVAVDRLEGGLVEISVRLPHLAATARPGEFAQLRCGDGIEPLLRRPFSVAWTDGDLCGFVLEAVGVGTRRLVALRPGDPLRALGPLGNGFAVDPPPAGPSSSAAASAAPHSPCSSPSSAAAAAPTSPS